MHPASVYASSNSKLQQDQEKNPQEQSQLKVKDCLSCRIWGGIAHLGIAAFVASHYGEMHSRGAKGFLLTFSSGLAYLGVARLFHLYPFPQETLSGQDKEA